MAQPPPGWQPAQYVLVPAPAPKPPVSGLAVTGFVFSLLFGCGILSAVGLVLSLAGLRATKDGRLSGRGLAIAGVVIGAVGAAFGLLWVVGWIVDSNSA